MKQVDNILDKIIPELTLDELKSQSIEELRQNKFVITNWNSGGIFNTLLLICLQIRMEIRNFARDIIRNMFLNSAEGDWIDLKAADFAKYRKEAVKTQGKVTVTRGHIDGNIKISKGLIFKTEVDINGDELKYYVLKDTILQQDKETVEVLVEAAKEGTRYNVPANRIIKSIVYLDGGCTLNNDTDWITREGADEEDYDGLRERTLRAWSEISTRPIREKYQNIAEGVPGVLFALIDDAHPRGQATTDIYITSSTGEASEVLIQAVTEEIEKAAIGTIDDIKVMSAATLSQNISIAVTVPKTISIEGLESRIQDCVINSLKINKKRKLNILYLSDINQSIRANFSDISNVKIITPTDDIVASPSTIIMPAEISIAIVRE